MTREPPQWDVPTEDRHTPPTSRCPHPERWHSPDSDSTESEVSVLLGALVMALKPDLVVETGTAYGWSTLCLAEGVWGNGLGRVVSLEVDEGRHQVADELLRKHDLRHVVDLRLQSSLDYVPDQPIGFALFDSLYELRCQEFLRWLRLGYLLPGTVVAFHDSTSGDRRHHYDVRQAVRGQLVAAGHLRTVELPTPRGLLLGEVLG